MDLGLAGKVALVAASSRGLGRAVAEELAAEGVAILFVSSELEEVLGMSDRALVMHEGRLTGELQRCELSEEAVMRMATGQEVATA